MHKLPNAAVPCAERCHASIQRQTRARCKARHSPSRPRETEARRKVSRATPHGTVAGTGSRRAATIAHRTSHIVAHCRLARAARPAVCCALPAVALTSTSHQGAPAGGYSDSNSEVKRKIAALKHSLQARPPPECTSNRQQQTAAGDRTQQAKAEERRLTQSLRPHAFGRAVAVALPSNVCTAARFGVFPRRSLL
jgi:hypothetical protein